VEDAFLTYTDLFGTGIGIGGIQFLFDKDKYRNYFLEVSQAIGKKVDIVFFGYLGKEALDYSSLSLHAGYLVRRNIRLVAEYTRQFSDNEPLAPVLSSLYKMTWKSCT
jgi:hypothetical protein